MKIFRRNAIIITVILFVCAAVYLNWAYNRREAELVLSKDDISTQTGLFYSPEQEQTGQTQTERAETALKNDYFATARLTRQQARDSAVSMLKDTADMSGDAASGSAVDAIKLINERSVTETNIENLIKAKGFDECIAFVDEDSFIVAVPASAEGLSRSAVSRITDAVISQTGCSTEQIKIIEVK
ncbi:MAG: SpoIIIAH-like family protein [Oscillospiraceae bacterium]|nr:SpoIIIAH-like family protein [Oscillospiraceae bacterium]